jgi:hypothetical protein
MQPSDGEREAPKRWWSRLDLRTTIEPQSRTNPRKWTEILENELGSPRETFACTDEMVSHKSMYNSQEIWGKSLSSWLQHHMWIS